MALNYYFNIKDGIFKYNCIDYSSYIKIRVKDIIVKIKSLKKGE